MASIGGLSSATSSLVSGGGGLHGYGGLASGLDRDTLIESMTYATRAKIAKQQQKKQTFQWKQDAYRSVTDKLVALSSKYMDYTNPTTNLSSSSLFAKTNIISNGKNASKVSITTNGTASADSLTILGVKQMAKNASATSGSAASDQVLKTEAINFGKEDVSVFQDQSLQIKYEGKTYTVNFGEIADSTNQTEVLNQLNKALENVKTGEGEGENLAKIVQFKKNGSEIALSMADNAQGSATVVGGSEKLLNSMGLKVEKDENGNPKNEEWKIQGNTITTKGEDGKSGISKGVDFKDRIAGQSLTFSYNGNQVTINMPAADKLKASTEDGAAEHNKQAVLDALQKGFDKAFGQGRIKVDAEAGKNVNEYNFTFKTIKASDGSDDETSVLTLDYGSAGMVGKHRAFHTLAGESNHMNLNASILDSGLDWKAKVYPDLSSKEQELLKKKQENSLTKSEEEELKAIEETFKGVEKKLDTDAQISINGKTIKVDKGSSINAIITAINNDPDMGVTVSYSKNSDKFTITSKADGASGKIKLGEGDSSKDENIDITNILFGSITEDDIKKGKGQDAVIAVQYAGSSEVVELHRGTNTFNQDGLNITVKGTFGYDESGQVQQGTGEEVTFESTANTENILKTIKDMVTAYNEIVDLVNSLVSTKPDRDYAPLTDDQKEEMSEEQIEKWEKKAKEGILFGDDLLRNLSSDLRFVAGGTLMTALEDIGISEASGYTSNGKLTIDENKLKNMLESEPDRVAKLFADPNNGLMTNMKKVTDSYAKTWGTKGSLIARAGSEASATSLTDNEIYASMKDIDSIIKQLQERLKSEQDRYISQFTTLETVIARMNSQSSYLSSMSGGY